MDTEQPENKSVASIVHDLDKLAEKKALKRENTLIGFVIKATARDQEKNILISKLQGELAKAQGLMNLLEMENDVKDQLMKEKEEEIDTLKNEILILKNAVKNTRHTSLNVEPSKEETPTKAYGFWDVVISTQSNIVASPTGDNDDIDVVSSSKSESTESQVNSSTKPRSKIVKKKSFKRTRELSTSILYNLRNRTKSKTSEKI